MLIHTSSGSCYFQQVKSDDIDFITTSGAIYSEGLETKTFNSKSSSGGCNLKNLKVQFLDIHSTSGKTRLTIVGKESDYEIKVNNKIISNGSYGKITLSDKSPEIIFN